MTLEHYLTRSPNTAIDSNRKTSFDCWVDQMAIDRWTNEGGALQCILGPQVRPQPGRVDRPNVHHAHAVVLCRVMLD